MKLIAHRGNISGPNPDKENNPEYIDEAINLGYDVEIDIRTVDDCYYLGHDIAQYQVPISWLVERKNYLWIHCKDIKSLETLSNSPVDFHYFWHQEDDYTLTSKKYIWVYPGKQHTYNSVVVMPENNISISQLKELSNCFGICSDYVGEIN